jgi:hypothetical protein
MAKKNLKIDIDTQNVDVHVERKDGATNVDLDTKNMDIKVSKTPDNVEVKVDAQGGLLKMIGKLIAKVITKRIK